MTKQVDIMAEKAKRAMKEVKEKARQDLKDAKIPEYVQDAETVQNIQGIQARYLSAKADLIVKLEQLKSAKQAFEEEGKFIIFMLEESPVGLTPKEQELAERIKAKYKDTSKIDKIIEEAEKAKERYEKILAHFTYKTTDDGKVEYSPEAVAVAEAISMI